MPSDREATMAGPAAAPKPTPAWRHPRMTQLSKREAVILLLRTRDDHAIRLKPNRVYRAAPKGAAPSARRNCPDCNGLAINWPCDRCKSKGWLLFDTYTEKFADDALILSGSSGDSRHEQRQKVDDKIRTLQAEWGEQREAPTDPLTGACLARDRQDRNGSYRELRACLTMLTEANTYWAAALTSMYGADEGFRDLTASFQAAAEQGLELVIGWMPDPVRVPAWFIDGGNRGFHDRQTKRKAA